MGVYFSIAHSINSTDDVYECSFPMDQNDNDQSDSEINRNIRSKTAMLFKFSEEAKRDDSNESRSEATFLPLSFIEFVEKRPVSFSNTPIVVIEGVPQSVQNMSRRSRRQSQQSRETSSNNSNNQETSKILKEIIPDLPQKFSYKNLNRELHQNFEISQYKVNAVRFWILKSNTIRERTMAKAVECCRHFDFTSYVSSQYVRVENIFSDVNSNDFQSLASALRPQGLSNLSNSPPNNKLKTSAGVSEINCNTNLKSDGLGGFMDFSKTAPISIPIYHKSEKQKMFNIQIDTNASNNVVPPKTQETPKFHQPLKAPIFPLLSTSPTPDKNTNLSENSSGNSSENLSENLSENSPEYLSENSSELLRNSLQSNTLSPPPSNKPSSLSLSPLRLPALTPERTCFSSRRPCEINCNNDYNNSLFNNCSKLEIPQFSGEDDFFNYSCYSEDDRIKFRYRNSNECDMVIPGLFIGGEKAAHDKKLLRNLKITHIVNLNFNDSGGEHLDENGKEIDYDDGIDDDTVSNDSNTTLNSNVFNQDSDSHSPFRIDPLNLASPQAKNKKSIFNQSPRSSFSFQNQNQQGKTISHKNDNENDNDDINKQKEPESENQQPQSSNFKIGKISRFNVRLSDSVFQDLNDDFWGALRFVEQAIHSGGNVLAHCRRGISRSAALCVAYLMDDRGMTFDDAIALLKRQRPSVNINQGFEDQLRSFSRTVQERLNAEKQKGNNT